MELKIKSLKQEIYGICSAEGLFFTGFIIFLVRGMWETTMLPLNGLVSQLCLLLPILFIGLKIIFFDTYSVSGYIGVIIGFSSTIIIYLNSGYLNPFFWVLILVGCKDISFEKILKIYLLITVSITLFALCAALLGVIENLIYETEGRGIRIAFGSVYVTDFASHIFYMILTFCYLKADDLKVYHFVGILIIVGLAYYFCKTRLDCISMFITVIIFGINKFLKTLKYDGKGLLKKWEKAWRWLGLFSMPLLTLISYTFTKLYQVNNSFLLSADKMLTSRLRLGKQGLQMYPVKFWGQPVEMVGAGGKNQLPIDYFFIDCSYIHIILRYGFFFLMALLVIYVLCCFKCKFDLYFLFVVTLVSLNSVIAHHIMDFTYNPFACMLLSCIASTRSMLLVLGNNKLHINET